jgi:hypothetical protein
MMVVMVEFESYGKRFYSPFVNKIGIEIKLEVK